MLEIDKNRRAIDKLKAQHSKQRQRQLRKLKKLWEDADPDPDTEWIEQVSRWW